MHLIPLDKHRFEKVCDIKIQNLKRFWCKCKKEKDHVLFIYTQRKKIAAC